MNELPPFVRAHAGGARLQVKVVPRNEIGELLGDRLKIKIAAPPVDSAANEALVAFLAKQLGVARGAVQITQGQASRNKTLVIHGLDAPAVASGLRAKS
jgi:uncharacterized protein (TIGR00251 family)